MPWPCQSTARPAHLCAALLAHLVLAFGHRLQLSLRLPVLPVMPTLVLVAPTVSRVLRDAIFLALTSLGDCVCPVRPPMSITTESIVLGGTDQAPDKLFFFSAAFFVSLVNRHQKTLTGIPFSEPALPDWSAARTLILAASSRWGMRSPHPWPSTKCCLQNTMARQCLPIKTSAIFGP